MATLNYNVPQASGNVTVNLLVTSGNASDSETRTLLHQPAVSNPWFDLGALTPDPITMVVGDRVNVRTVSSTGQDAFWPTTPITITAANTGATQWPVTLANAVNALNGAVRIGVLNAQNQVVPQANATSNRVFSHDQREHRERLPAASRWAMCRRRPRGSRPRPAMRRWR